MGRESVWLVRGVCFQVAHADPQSLSGQWEQEPTFQAIQDAARAAHLVLIPVVDVDQSRLVVTIGRMLACLSAGWRVYMARDTGDNLGPAAEALRIRLRVFIIASGYAADEDAGLVLLTAPSLSERRRIIGRPDALDHQLERLASLVAVEGEAVYETHGA